MSKMMSDLMAKQQQINVASQSEIPPPTRQGLRLDKSPTVNTNPTLQPDDAILIDTSASPSVPVPHSPPNDENAKLLAKLDQRSRTGAGQSPLPPSINDIFYSVGVVGVYKHLNLSPTEDDLGLIFPKSPQALTDSPKKHGKVILVSLSDDSEDDQTPYVFKKPESKVVDSDFNDDISYLTGWFVETSIGAITEGPLEGMGASP
ncbi:hypothetical protein NL676_001520 [Syzygium grande]|nr:hypothetical protein NL676_001520 [Syzygium grande]